MSIHELNSVQKRAGSHQNFVLSMIFILVSALTLFSGSGQAQTTYKTSYGEWEGTIFAGGSFLGSSNHETPVEGSPSRTVGLKYDSGFQIGGRVTTNRWQRWGAAVEYSFSSQPVTFTNIIDESASVKLDHAIHRFSYDVIYYFYDRNYKMRPYVFGGPGVSLFHISKAAKNAAAEQGVPMSDPWKFTTNWGGGLKYQLGGISAASIQFSDSISGVPSYGLPNTGSYVSGQYFPGFRPSGLMHNWLISGGFLFQWHEK